MGDWLASIICSILIYLLYKYRKHIKALYIKASSKILFWLGPVFGRSVGTKYTRLIYYISLASSDTKVISCTKNTVVLHTVNSLPIEWTIYRDMENKESYDYANVKVTCRYLSGNFTLPITQVFPNNADPFTIYNTVLLKLTNAKVLTLKNEKSKGKA